MQKSFQKTLEISLCGKACRVVIVQELLHDSQDPSDLGKVELILNTPIQASKH